MRLDRYLNEAIKPQLMKAVKITSKSWNQFLTMLDIHWKKNKKLNIDDLTSMLDQAFAPYNIEFEQVSRETEKELEGGEHNNVFALGGLHDFSGTIFVELSKETPKAIAKTIKRSGDIHNVSNSPLFSEIIEVLAHEFVHREAFKKAGDLSFPREQKKFSYKKYLGDTQEVVAYGQQYANDVYMKRKTDIEEIYRETFGKTHKVYKKFLKVYRQTLDALKRGDVDLSDI